MYDVMLIIGEMHDFDTLTFCNTQYYERRIHHGINEIKDRKKNPDIQDILRKCLCRNYQVKIMVDF